MIPLLAATHEQINWPQAIVICVVVICIAAVLIVMLKD